ncbi:MAG: hydroxyacylglutathione hydrolase family protein [bacterium]
MKVIQFPLELNYVNSFLCIEEKSNDAFLVDCGAFAASVKNYIEENALNLQYLLITHSHYDHVDGVDDFRKAFKVPIYAAASTYDRQVSEGDRIPFGDSEIAVFTTPGHIADGLSFYLKPAVFVGDAIFAGAVGGTAGRPQFEEEIAHVAQKILTLPEETVIYPGHGAPSLVAVERLYNPFFV